MMKMFKRYRKINYKGIELNIEQTEYASNGRYALQAYAGGDPYDVLTVNIEGYDKEFPKADIIFLNTNHVPGIKDVLLEAGLIEDMGCKVQSGFCTYPVARWLG